jgi:16S rRNA (uracil1498-N3)-methyltransferase
VIEASKQCGRNRLLQMEEPQDWPDFVENAADMPRRLMAQPQGFHRSSHLPLPEKLSEPVVLAIGPEGGFTGEETALAVTAGWHTINLGPRTLRVETAALMLVAMLIPRMTF